uniref:Uncharacterized protein n=1 Tax=Peronospora matthiolae TaxID=2874970 RepID=A0AAV1VC88_9STRA
MCYERAVAPVYVHGEDIVPEQRLSVAVAAATAATPTVNRPARASVSLHRRRRQTRER